MSEPRPLSPRPDLRELRGEAKRRHDAGEFPTLALAQLAVAREHGFRSWPRLKFHVEALTLDASARAAALIASATSSNLHRARTLLELDPDLARYDLACACATGEVDEVARRLAAWPAAASEPAAPNGWPPILYACFSRLLRRDPRRAVGIREAARRLLAAGADPNAWFAHGDWLQVALYGAAGINGDPELTRMLLDAGADPTDDRDGFHGNEALYHACEHLDPTCARLLIDAGARADFVRHDLGRALNFPNHAMVEMFCTHGAQPTADHLHQAVWCRRPARTVAVLLDAGAPVDEPDERGVTPLRTAVRWGDAEVVALLRERGARRDAVTDEDEALGAYLSAGRGATGPAIAPAAVDAMLVSAIPTGDLETVRRLLDAGARLDGDPATDEVPLGQACWRGRAEIAYELIDRGASPVFPDGGSALGATLHGSRHCQHPEGGPSMATVEEIPSAPYAEIARRLLAAGAEVPERIGERGPRGVTLLAELGVDLL